MTYKEILASVSDKVVSTYKSYLDSKIEALTETNELLSAKTEHYQAEYDRLEKKLIALIATVRNEDSLNEQAPDDFEEEFTK